MPHKKEAVTPVDESIEVTASFYDYAILNSITDLQKLNPR